MVNPATALHQASSSREATVVLLKVPLLANSVAILSRATRHPAHSIQDTTAHRLPVLLLVNMARLLDLRDSTVHHPQVLLPGNTSLQLHISKRLRDLRHHPASATFPAKSQT